MNNRVNKNQNFPPSNQINSQMNNLNIQQNQPQSLQYMIYNENINKQKQLQFKQNIYNRNNIMPQNNFQQENLNNLPRPSKKKNSANNLKSFKNNEELFMQNTISNFMGKKSKTNENKDNINKSITEKINALDPNNQNQDLNAQFEIHEDENFENYITRIGENLKYLIKNQKGSRSMQNFLDKIYPEHVNILLDHISSSLKEIMMDPYGNYFIQKLIQSSSLNQRNIIFNTVKLIPLFLDF